MWSSLCQFHVLGNYIAKPKGLKLSAHAVTSTRSNDKIDVAMLVIMPTLPSAATSAWHIACMVMMEDNQWRDEGQSPE